MPPLQDSALHLSDAVYYNFSIQGIFSLLYHMEDTPLFLNIGASLSRAWSHTKDFSLQAHLSFVRQVGATIVLLGKHFFFL